MKKMIIKSTILAHYLVGNIILTFLIYERFGYTKSFVHFYPFGILPLDLSFYILLWIYSPLIFLYCLTGYKVKTELIKDKTER